MIGCWVGQDFRLVTDTWLVVVGGLVGLVATGFGVYAVVRAPKLLLTACVLAAVSALLLVGGWLLAVPGTSRVDVLKTSGLAGAAVLALYGLWINDRRRRTEEARHQLDRERISDERFAKAVELLGKEADQVRVGALHVLAGLARARPDYSQTVLDVLCAYLRRPFPHPSYQSNPADPGRAEVAPSDERWTEEHGIADRERQVRATAQRLITELLPSSSAPEPESYNLDLTGAALEFFNLSGCHIGQLTARRAHFYGSTRLDNLRASRIMLLSGARFSGRLDLSYARLEDGLSLFEAQVHGEFRVKNTLVWRMLDVRASAPTEQIGSITAAEDTTIKPEPPNGWALAAKQAAPTEIASAT